RNSHRRIKRDQQRKLQKHWKASADRNRVLRHFELLHLERSHTRVIDRNAFLLQIFDLVLNFLHLRRIARSFLERSRLRPSQRKQKRIEKERKNDDRQAVVIRYRIYKVERPKDRYRNARRNRPDPRVITEVDQRNKIYIMSGFFRKSCAVIAQAKVILRTCINLYG